MDRLPLAIALSLLCALPAAARAQDPEFPTPEEYSERAAAAEAAPLFQSHEPLKITLTTDIEWLRDERNDSIEVEGTLLFIDLDGSEATSPVEVRTRGNFRRDKRNCNFPPLRLDVPTGQMEGTVFEGQDKLKLVTPCHDGRGSYQNYVFDEYLAYRTFNIITPYSFRVRPVEVTYIDIEDDYDSRTKVGFLIEDEDAMAERNRATIVDVTQFHPMRMDGEHAVTVALFTYLIGNLDWSPVSFHNSKLLRTEDGRYLTVPYDFDFAGIVNARYSGPPPQLMERVRRVTQRLFRGFCRPELVYETAVPVFQETREPIRELFESFGALGLEEYDDGDAEDTLDWFDDFYKVIDDPEEFEDEILDDCRDPATGR
jgi:hypothetical protein